MIVETQIEAALPAVEPAKKGSPWSGVGRCLTGGEWEALKKWRLANPELRRRWGERALDGKYFQGYSRTSMVGEVWVKAEAWHRARSKDKQREQLPAVLKRRRERRMERYYTDESSRARTLIAAKKWRVNNPEKFRAGVDKWCAEHRNDLRIKRLCVEKSRRRRERMTGNQAEKVAACRARKRNVTVETHPNRKEIKDLYAEAKRRSAASGTKYAVDHVIPINSGGIHHHNNLQILPNSINTSKGHNPFWISGEYLDWRDVPKQLWPDHLRGPFLAMLFVFGHPLKTEAGGFDY